MDLPPHSGCWQDYYIFSSTSQPKPSFAPSQHPGVLGDTTSHGKIASKPGEGEHEGDENEPSRVNIASTLCRCVFFVLAPGRKGERKRTQKNLNTHADEYDDFSYMIE